MITFNRKQLSSTLGRLSATVGTGIIPSTFNVLIRKDGDMVVFATTDTHSTGIEYLSPLSVSDWDDVTVPHKQFRAWVDAQVDDNIKLKTKENGDVLLTCGRSRLTLRHIVATEFPQLPTFPKSLIQLNYEDFIDGLKSVVWCADHETYVPQFQGVWIAVGGRKLEFTARGSAQLGNIVFEADIEDKVEVMIRADIVQKMLSALPKTDSVYLGVDDSRVYVVADNYYFAGQRTMLDGFIDWRKPMNAIFADGGPCVVNLENGNNMARILSQVSSLYGKDTATKLTVGNGLIVIDKEAQDDYVGVLHVEVEADVQGESEIFLDARIASKIFGLATQQTTVKFAGKKNPMMVLSGNRTYLLQGMNIEYK